jgi:hypothetical protein
MISAFISSELITSALVSGSFCSRAFVMTTWVFSNSGTTAYQLRCFYTSNTAILWLEHSLLRIVFEEGNLQ